MSIQTINTVERLIPKMIDQTDNFSLDSYQLHMQRYIYAAEYKVGNRILDIACGVGYGSHYLAQQDEKVEVIGVDISEASILYAQKNYQKTNVHFLVHDALTYYNKEGFSTIVSLETIEHIPNTSGFLGMIKKNLQPDGIFIASIPLGLTSDLNPHHVHDFSEKSFFEIMEKNDFVLINKIYQHQKARLRDIFFLNKRSRLSQLRPHLALYYLRHPFIALQRILYTLRFGLNLKYIVSAWKIKS